VIPSSCAISGYFAISRRQFRRALVGAHLRSSSGQRTIECQRWSFWRIKISLTSGLAWPNSSVSVSFIAGSVPVRHAVRSKGCSGIVFMYALAGHHLFQHLFIQSRSLFRCFWLQVEED
jgi:hypothetical protein